MDTAYTLHITTVIHADDYNDRMEISYPCAYSCENGTHRLKYDDADNGLTVCRISPDGEIRISRRRSASLLLRQGYAHRVDYPTPYGTIPMTFTLQSAVCTLSPQGGALDYLSLVHIDGDCQQNRVIMELLPNERIEPPL